MIRPWARLAGFFLAAAVVGSLCEAVARAEPVRPSVVQIVVTGEAGTTSALEQLVKELVSELPVELEWSGSRAIDPRQVLARHTDDRRVLVRAWVDLSDAKRAKIYVANGESERFIVRFVPEPNGYDPVAREALGQILESSIAAFVAHADAGISRADAAQKVADENPESVDIRTKPPLEKPRVAPPAPVTPTSASSPFDAGLAYQGALLDSTLAMQHGLSLILGAAVGQGTGPRLVLRASVGYRAQARLEDEKIDLRLSGGTARLAAGPEADVTSRLALGALVGGGLDLVFVEPVARSATTRAYASARNVEPFLLLMGTAKLRLGSALGLFMALGTELDLGHPRYGVDSEGGLTPVFTPWLLRPTLLLGLWTGFGGRRNEIE